MVLDVGMAGKAKFIPLIKKTNIFECGDNGIVLEREKGIITLYVTNAACSVIYARVTLGKLADLRGNVLVAIAYSEDVMLVDGGHIKIVIDYAEKAVAINQEDLIVKGSKHWGEDVQIDWEDDYNEFFNAPVAYVQ